MSDLLWFYVVQVVIGCYRWLCVVIGGYMRLYVIGGYMRLCVIGGYIDGYKML